MPSRTQPRPPQGANVQAQARASVVRPQGAQDNRPSPSQALVAVTREIDSRLALVRASAAAGITPDRLKLVALTVFTRTPSLMECDPVSVARAIVEAGQLGLEPTGLLGGAYLVPRKGKATLLVGYKGLVILAKRSGEVQRVEARVVREKDFFDYEYGLVPRLVHKPSADSDPGKYTHAYAVIHYRDGDPQFDVMTYAEIDAIRRRSSSPDDGPWVTDWAEMAKKTPLRRLMKLAPLTVDVAAKLDEIDPEVGDYQPAVSTREAELRQELQTALQREYGTAPEQPRLAAGATTPGGHGAGGPSAAEAPVAEGAGDAPRATDQATPVAAAGATPAAAPAAPAGPESVGAILGTGRQASSDQAPVAVAPACGVTYPPIGAGPCVLPAGHVTAAWVDAQGRTNPPQGEHQQADGQQWTQPRGGQQRWPTTAPR